MSAAAATRLGVAGLTHLGCVIAAAWSDLGYEVRCFDPDPTAAATVASGRATISEPGLDDLLTAAVARGTLLADVEPTILDGLAIVFLAMDTPVDEHDLPDVEPLFAHIDAIATAAAPDVTVVVSAQTPVGVAARLRDRLRSSAPAAALVNMPENLRLGEALACYGRAPFVVLGGLPAERAVVAPLAVQLSDRVIETDLATAEMTKHCLNTFLATCVTLADVLSDVCRAQGVDFSDVAGVLRLDPRVGDRAYLSPGIGFSGGTLGRDLAVLEALAPTPGHGAVLGATRRFNEARPRMVVDLCREVVGDFSGARLAVLGLTYKAGTSTVRRSGPLAAITALAEAGCELAVFDPIADEDVPLPPGATRAASLEEAVAGSSAVVVLTAWAGIGDLDFDAIGGLMVRRAVVDPLGALRGHHAALRARGYDVAPSVRPEVG